MTKTKPDVMTDEEELAIIEKSLRNQRIKPAIRDRLLSKRERLLKRMGRGPGRPPEQSDSRFAEFTEPQRRVLEGRSLLGKLNDEDREMWEWIFRRQNERENEWRAQRQPQPKQDPAPAWKPGDVQAFFERRDAQRQARPMKPTDDEVKTALNGGVPPQPRQVAAPAQPTIQADFE